MLCRFAPTHFAFNPGFADKQVKASGQVAQVAESVKGVGLGCGMSYFLQSYRGWTDPHPVMVTIRDNHDCIGAQGAGVLLILRVYSVLGTFSRIHLLGTFALGLELLLWEQRGYVYIYKVILRGYIYI